MGLLRNVAALLFLLALPVALVTTNIRIALNEPRLYEYATDHYDTPSTTGIPRDELLRASGELRDYFNSGDDAPIFVRVRDRNGEPIQLFNAQETAHLSDVRTLFRGSNRVQEAAVVFVLAYIVAVFIWAREGSLRKLARQVLLSALLSVAAIGALGVGALVGFDQLWNQFHFIAFSNDFWQLDPATDHLIQMFPEGFWEDVSLWIGLATAAQVATLAAASGVYLWLTRNSSVTYGMPHRSGPAGLGSRVPPAG